MVVASRSFAVTLALALLPLAVPGATAPPPPCALGTYVSIDSPADGSAVAGVTPVGGSSEMCGDVNSDGFVVIAVTDTGINPYNPDFGAVKGQPAGHPSTYVDGFPASMGSLKMTCTATTSIHTACASDFASAAASTPYWLEGTKVIAAISFDPMGAARILDENGHGTHSASVALGNTNGLCPACLLVVVEGLGTAGVAWAANQPYIDIITNSWVAAAGGLHTNVGGEYIPESQAMAEDGGTVLFAAGNGHENMFITPMQTYESGFTGVDWHLVVGAIFPGDTSVLGSGKPVHVSSYGAAVPSACHTDKTSSCTHGGTSAATPQVAGALGHVLTKAKRLLGSAQEGPAGKAALPSGELLGIAAAGDAVPGNQYLDDGKLTRQELWNLVLRTAAPLSASPGLSSPPSIGLPASDADYAYTGYGIVNEGSRDDATSRLEVGADLPDTADVDEFIRQDSEVRILYWGPWAETKMGTGIGDAGVAPGPAPPPVVKLKVNGMPAGTAAPDAAGLWAASIDFSAFPDAAGAWTVRAEYAGATDTVTYVLATSSGGGGGGAGDGTAPPEGDTGTRAAGDRDRDGVDDRTDNCHADANGGQEDQDGDRRGDPCDGDRDGDTVPDSEDRCPLVADRDQMDRDGDGRGDVCDDDRDGDGVLDRADNCPLAPNPDQRNSDLDPPGDACEAPFGPQRPVLDLGSLQQPPPKEPETVPDGAEDRSRAGSDLPFQLAMWTIAIVLTAGLIAILVAARRRDQE